MSGPVFQWYSSNTKIDYPFDARQSDGSHELFVDAYVSHNKYQSETSRLQLVSFDPTGNLQLKFEDGTALVSLTPADSFNSSVFGDYTIYRWQRSNTIGPGFTNEDIAVQVVVLTNALASFTFPLVPPAAFLQSSLVNPKVPRVRRLALALEGVPCCAQFTTDQVALKPGNNMNITVQADAATPGLGIVNQSSLRKATTIVFDAIPGAGAGKIANCDSLTPPIKEIDTQGPNSIGNFFLTGVDCTWVERRVLSSSPPIHPHTDYLAVMHQALLQLHQDCKACCDCIDYGNAYDEMVKIWNRLKKAAATIEDVRKKYNALVEKIKQIKVIRETGLNVKTQVIARPDFFIAALVTIYNDSKNDITTPIDIVIVPDLFNLDYIPQSGILDIEGSHKVQVDPHTIGNGYYVTVPGLRSTAYAQYSLELRVPPTALDISSFPLTTRVGRVVRVNGVGTYPPSTIAEDIVSIELVGPLVKS